MRELFLSHETFCQWQREKSHRLSELSFTWYSLTHTQAHTHIHIFGHVYSILLHILYKCTKKFNHVSAAASGNHTVETSPQWKITFSMLFYTVAATVQNTHTHTHTCAHAVEFTWGTEKMWGIWFFFNMMCCVPQRANVIWWQ